ncbi:uroporphyrinogen-III C-methyltransferase [Gilvimarinus sp. DA14]|uniref:uroporphyrinogen-III C-methyltransferase n=1 Tax=Gilvimarinus sp. DA14 TaxID=2956798 RepID=UPI0020B65210|nr:uroporphyrinogen-III C-methyltransferase [Gilvimarinus sp. DA14]UTF58701.1 uroporphyrinogen-III C-methyltransferase [Gilvimarinus sp. DA14]
MSETPAEHPEQETQSQGESVPAEQDRSEAEHKSAQKPARKTGGAGLAWFCLLLLLAAAVAGGWYGWQMWQQLQALQARELPAPVEAPPPFDAGPLERQLAELQQQNNTLSRRLEQLANAEIDPQLVRSLAADVGSVQSRLDAMADTSRDDWKLAEAAFLLRLANQKVLVEHNSSEALALAQAADKIIKEQDDPGLFAIRQALSQEMTELKMVEPVDREGIYLQLQALIDQVSQLPLLQSFQRQLPVATEAQVQDPAAEAGAWARVKASVMRGLQTLGSLVRVNNHAEPVEPLLGPEQAWFLRQNLQLMLEQAQIALLREESRVYHQSLERAQDWLQKYFSRNAQTQVVSDELQKLDELAIKVEVPDISAAQQQLQDYIDRLHKVSGGQTP